MASQVSILLLTNDECLHLHGPLASREGKIQAPTGQGVFSRGNKGGLTAAANLAVDALLSLGAKHKQKEKEKLEKKQSQNANHGHVLENGDDKSTTGSTSKSSKGSKDEKDKKKKKKSKDEKAKNGTEGLKKPLSAYMLFNNYRRPILKKEHPSKYTAYCSRTCSYLVYRPNSA